MGKKEFFEENEIKRFERQIQDLELKYNACFDIAHEIYRKYWSCETNWKGDEWGAKYRRFLRRGQEVRKKANIFLHKLVEIEAEKRARENNEKEVFVNSLGEATHRYITSATYERQRKRLSKRIISLLGG